MTYLVSIIFALITFKLSKNEKVGPIRSSCIVSIVGFFIIPGISNFGNFEKEFYILLVFGTSFVGMSTDESIGYKSIILMAILFAGLFIHLIPLLHGMGGALGVSAFVATTLISISRKSISFLGNLLK